MTLAFSLPLAAESFLTRRDPRWKLLALAPAAGLVSLLHSLPACGLAFAWAATLACLCGISIRWYLGRLAALALVLLFFVILLPFLVFDGGPVVALGPLELSLIGLELALLLCLKSLAVFSLMLVLLVTAPLEANLKAAHALHFPGLLIQVVVLTYRYLFLLADELTRMLIALRVRGHRLHPAPRRFLLMEHLTGALLVRGYERAERVSQAMRTRGFDGRYRSLSEFRTTWPDVGFLLAVVAMCVGLVLVDLL